MKKLLAAAAIAATISIAPASATTFVFKGDGNNVTPLGAAGVDFDTGCATGGDFCSIDHSVGLLYTLDMIGLQIRSYSGGAGDGVDLGMFDRLIQDIVPGDSGMGSFSVGEGGADDQTQASMGESLEFIFDTEYLIRDVEFNAGGDRDCTLASDGSGEGSCGSFILQVFNAADMLTNFAIIDMTNMNFVNWGAGKRFVITAITQGSGFTIAQLTAGEVPIPAALPLLLSGIAGLGFASRKQKTA